MFSIKQKQYIAKEVEKILLQLQHPEMPVEKPSFILHVKGSESWSFADIRPNWEFDNNHKPTINPWNELIANEMEKKVNKKQEKKE